MSDALPAEIAVRFEGVSKDYLVGSGAGRLKQWLFRGGGAQERARALDSVSFELRRGRSLGVIGENGTGKSTLLGLIAGVLDPTEGSVASLGRICPLLQLAAGFEPELPGRVNVTLNGVLLGATRREVRDRYASIVAFAELEDVIDQPIRTYSTGMIARLGFAIATSLDPDILLVDETLSVGDARFQEKCVARLEDLRRRGVTMVFVSHDAVTIERVCDEALLLDHGRLRLHAPVGEVLDAYLGPKRKRAAAA